MAPTSRVMRVWRLIQVLFILLRLTMRLLVMCLVHLDRRIVRRACLFHEGLSNMGI